MPSLVAFFGPRKLISITSADIDAFADMRVRAGMSARTVNLDINFLSSIFQYAVSQGFAYDNPARQVKRLKTVQVENSIPSNEAIQKLVGASRQTETGVELATWIVFRAYTGTRPAESFFVEWKDIDFERNLVMICPKEGNPLKNRKVRAIPMHSELRTALLEWKGAWDAKFALDRKHDWVFFNPRYPGLRCQRFEKSFPRAQRLAGMTERMTSHCLRHFFISRAVEAGVNFLVIAKWVGHSSTRMIEQVYAHLSPGFKAGEMTKIQLGLGNGTGTVPPPTPGTEKRG